MKKIRIYLVIFLALLTLLFVWSQHRLLSSTLVEYSNLIEIEENVYVSPSMEIEEQAYFLEQLSEAKKRIAKKFGHYSASPVIIYSPDEAELATYASNSYGSTHFSTNRAYVVIGKNGSNLDVISHELVHAELFERVGYWKRFFQIPVWFDEGMAMQVDYRKQYDHISEENIKIKNLKYGWQFFKSENLTDHYALAKREVATWLEQSGDKAFYLLLDQVKKGHGFDDVYKK